MKVSLYSIHVWVIPLIPLDAERYGLEPRITIGPALLFNSPQGKIYNQGHTQAHLQIKSNIYILTVALYKKGST